MSKPIQQGIMRIDDNIDLLQKNYNKLKIDISDIKSELKQIKSIMNEEKITSLCVTNKKKTIGLIHIHNILAGGIK